MEAVSTDALLVRMEKKRNKMEKSWTAWSSSSPSFLNKQMDVVCCWWRASDELRIIVPTATQLSQSLNWSQLEARCGLCRLGLEERVLSF